MSVESVNKIVKKSTLTWASQICLKHLEKCFNTTKNSPNIINEIYKSFKVENK